MNKILRLNLECPADSERCLNCNDIFKMLKPQVKEVIVSKHFIKDYPNFNIKPIIDCDHRYSKKLHKFEFKTEGSHVFRALIGKTHILYVVDRDFRLIFLRGFDNFLEYGKFLGNKKKLATIIQNN
jgi:hypothetical protein